jgi:hypothetical protein
MMDELVLNEVEGKEFFTIKMVYFRPYPQYSSIPFFHAGGRNKKISKDLYFKKL